MDARPNLPRVTCRPSRWRIVLALGVLSVVLVLDVATVRGQFFPAPQAPRPAAARTLAPATAAAPVQTIPQTAPQPAPQLAAPTAPATPPVHFVPALVPQHIAEKPPLFVDAYWTEPDVVGDYSLINVVDPAFDHVQVLAMTIHQEAVPADPALAPSNPPAEQPAAPAVEGPTLNAPEELPAPGNQPAGQPAAGSQANNLNEARNIGRAPEDTSLFFLRRQTVLLEPGQHQLDVGFSYSLVEDDIPVALTDAGGDVTGVTRGRLRQRLLQFPIELRYGLFKRMQMFLNIPLGGAGTELAFKDFDDHSTQVGIGDLRFGSTFLVHQGERFGPDFITTLDFTFPTGDESFPLVTATPDSRFGEGFFALSVSGLWIHTFDPCVLFYGVGYRHRFETEIENVLVAPGEQFYYQLGVGFAVNDYITLSASYLGFYISETYLDDDRVEGSALEPMRLRLATTISRPEARVIPTFVGAKKVREIIEPFAEIGMTDDGPSSRIGITWTY
jgi:hypothetical protein